MKVIRGTGDAKKMKGNAVVHARQSMRCTNCGQQAFPLQVSDGSTIYKCSACGTKLKAVKF